MEFRIEMRSVDLEPSGPPEPLQGPDPVEADLDGPASGAILTVPNVLSLLRLASVPFFIWLFVSGRENAAVILYGVGATTDFFDGYLARRLGAISELGRLLDPLADRIFIMALAVALVGRGTMPLWLAAVIVGRDIAVLTAYPLLERRKVKRLRVNFVGKTATAFLLLGLTLLAWSETTFPAADPSVPVGFIATLLGAALYWVAGGIYAREAVRRIADDGARVGPDVT